MFSKRNVIKLFLLLLIMMLIGACSGSATTQTKSSQAASTQTDSTQVESSTEANVIAQSESSEVETTEIAESGAIQPLELAPNIDVQTVASVIGRDDVFLLDVREQSEYDAGHIAGNTLIPTGSIAERLAEIPKDKEVIVYCHSGNRSAQVAQFLNDQGYTNVHNMLGGIVAWQQAGLDVKQ